MHAPPGRPSNIRGRHHDLRRRGDNKARVAGEEARTHVGEGEAKASCRSKAQMLLPKAPSTPPPAGTREKQEAEKMADKLAELAHDEDDKAEQDMTISWATNASSSSNPVGSAVNAGGSHSSGCASKGGSKGKGGGKWSWWGKGTGKVGKNGGLAAGRRGNQLDGAMGDKSPPM